MDGIPIRMDVPPAHSSPVPDRADVVVIGGGIVGVMTAWFLAKKGLTVFLAEKGRIAGEQSGRNWGWVRQQGRDPAELPLMIEANRIWRGLAAEAEADLGLRQTGVLYLADDAAGMARYEGWMVHAREHQLDTRLLSADEVAAMMPGAARRWAGGLWTASDCRAEPFVAVPALARAAARAGVAVREGCAVRALDVEAGRLAGVVTEAGRVRAGSVVLAGGAWSVRLLARHGVALPQLSVRATVAATAPMAEVFAGGAADRRIAWRRRADGGYTLAPGGFHEFFIGPDAIRHAGKFWTQLKSDPFGTRFLPMAPKGYPDAWGTRRRWAEDEVSPFEGCRVLNPVPNRGRLARLRQDFAATFPGAGEVRLARGWAGMIDTMPDEVPVIDHVPALPGLVLATGFSGHGFGIGPAAGRVVADLVTGGAVGHDLARFRFGRFSDGSRIELGPAL